MTLSPQLRILVILFCISTALWIFLIFYRSRLERESEEAFRTTPERLKTEQAAALQKVDRLSKPVWLVGTVTVLLLLATLGLWVVQGLGL